MKAKIARAGLPAVKRRSRVLDLANTIV